MACNRPFPIMLLLLIAACLQAAQCVVATKCKATSTSSTSLATNITTTHSRLSCSSDDFGEPVFLRCSVNATVTPTAINNSSTSIAAESAYSCYLKNTSVSAPVRRAPNLTGQCNGLFTASPVASTSPHPDQSNATTSIAIDGTDSCSFNAAQPVLHLDVDETSHCISTSGTASTDATTTSTFCSVVTLIKDGSASVFTQKSTYNCTTIQTITHQQPDLEVRSYTLCFLNTTDLGNTTQYTHNEAFAHGAMFRFT